MSEDIYEIKPRRDSLERVLSRLSIGSTTQHPDEIGSTSGAQITTSEFAGMLSGIDAGSDRHLRETAEMLAWAYLDPPSGLASEYPATVEKLIIHIDIWGRQRILFQQSSLSVTGLRHRAVVKAVVERHVLRRYPQIEDLRQAMGLSRRRWPLWRDWVGVLTARLNMADRALARHLSAQLRESQNVTLETEAAAS